MTYPQTTRTTPSRYRERTSYERAAACAILDEAYHCHLGFAVQGEVRLLPMLHVRVDDTVYLHGSSGGRPLLAARAEAGLPVCIAVTHLDGIVYGRSQFHHSANYRSVVAHGVARLVTDEAEKRGVLTALVEKVGRGRATDSRPPTRRELAETSVLALPLAEVSVKTRAGGPADDPADDTLPYWAGVVPLRLVPGVPEPGPGVTTATPHYLWPPRSAWHTAAPLRGEHVVLEPLDLSHVDGLFAATADDAVWEFLTSARPGSRAALAEWVAGTVQTGGQVAWVQRCARTGEVVGSTSYYAIDEANRSLAIGYTVLGRPWWRTGVNTEAKLLLLRRAFDELGAVRVEWHTDTRNTRSQAAIERLGATREGTLRAHRQRADGSWRDSALYAMTAADWPAAHERLAARLREPAPAGEASG